MKNITLNIKAESLNFSRILNKIQNNINYIMMYSMFLCGVIIGCAVIINSGNIFSSAFHSTDLLKSFIFINLINIIALTVNFIMGFCCVGIPVIFINMIFFGIFLGADASLLLMAYSYDGIAHLMLRLPFVIVIGISVILSSALSMNMSECLIRLSFFGNCKSFPVKKYLVRYLIFVISSVFSSVLYILPQILM